MKEAEEEEEEEAGNKEEDNPTFLETKTSVPKLK